MSSLFGGGGGQTQTTTQNATTNVNYAPWYESYAKDILARGQALSQTPFQPYDVNQMFAPFQPAQLQAFNQVGQNQNMYQPFLQAGTGALNRVSGYDPYSAGMPFLQAAAQTPTGFQAGAPYMQNAAQTWNPQTQAQYTNPFLAGSVGYANDLASQNFLEKTLPGINAQFVKSGGGLGGSNYTRFMNRAVRDYANAQVGQAQTAAANNYWQGAGQFNQDLNRQLQVGQGLGGLATGTQGALGNLGQTAAGITSGAINTGTGLAGAYSNLGGQLSNLNLANTNALLQVGTQQQQNAQNPLTAAYQQYQQGVQFPYNQLSWLSNLSSGLRIPSTQNMQSTSTQTQTGSSSPSIMGSILGTAGAALGIPGVKDWIGGLFGSGAAPTPSPVPTAGSLNGATWTPPTGTGFGVGTGGYQFPSGSGGFGYGTYKRGGAIRAYADGGTVLPERNARHMRGYGGTPVGSDSAMPVSAFGGMSRMPFMGGMLRGYGMSPMMGYQINPSMQDAPRAWMPSGYQQLAGNIGMQPMQRPVAQPMPQMMSYMPPPPPEAPAAAPPTPAQPSAAELWARSGMDANTTAGARRGGAIRRYSQGGTVPVVKAMNMRSKPALAMAAQNQRPPVPMPRPSSGALAQAAAPMMGGALSAVR